MVQARTTTPSYVLERASDSELVARVLAQDDRRAFAALVGRHQGAVRALLCRLSRGDVALADDLAQATFLLAYTRLAQFQGAAQLRTWLYRIACNEFFAHRRQKRGVEELSHDVLEEAQASAHDLGFAASSDLAIDMTRALAQLAEPERDAIVACYYADLSHSEAAQLLACPLGTLKSNIARGKARLQLLLMSWASEREKTA